MWRLAILLGVAVLAGCGPGGARGGVGAQGPAVPGDPAQAVGSALAFAAHSDPDVAVVDGYASLPRRVQRGDEPIDLIAGHVMPCARRPQQPFGAGERRAILAAFHGRNLSFVADPAAALRARGPGALLLVAGRPLLDARRGTVLVVRCVPGPEPILVDVQWDGRAWQATATAGRQG